MAAADASALAFESVEALSLLAAALAVAAAAAALVLAAVFLEASLAFLVVLESLFLSLFLADLDLASCCLILFICFETMSLAAEVAASAAFLAD